MVKLNGNISKLSSTRPASAPIAIREHRRMNSSNRRRGRNYVKSRSLNNIDDYDSYSDNHPHEDFSEADFNPWCCQAENKDIRDKAIRDMKKDHMVSVPNQALPTNDSNNHSNNKNNTNLASSWLLVEPPKIKRNSNVGGYGVQENFPPIMWEGTTSTDIFLDFAEDEDDSLSKSAWETEGLGSDESTVVISNISDTGLVKKTPSHRKIGSDNHESLLDIFQIKLSAPLALPKEKRRIKLNDFLRSPSARQMMIQSRRSVNAAKEIPASNEQVDDWFQHATFHQLQEYILMGVPMKSEEKKFRSPQRIGSLLKKGNVIMKRTQTTSPAKKLDHILSRKQSHRRSSSDSVQRIKAILSRKSGFKIQIPTRNELSKMDDAVTGRLDGLDIINMGSVRKVSYIGEKERSLSGQRYTLRCMILDSLYSASTKDPSEIVFEGFSQRGEGNDRWTCRIEGWKSCDSANSTNLWGKGNAPPPLCESKLNEIQISPKSTASHVKCTVEGAYVFQTLEQLQAAHEHAVEPLKLGHVHKSIIIFKKILRGLQAKYKTYRGMNHVIGSTCHNIAVLYMCEGCFEDALNYMNMAVNIRVKTLGYFHSSVAVSLAKLGLIYFALERSSSSIRSFNQALDIRMKLSDEDRVQTAKLLNNLGVVLFHRGEKGNAMDRLIDALRIQKKWIEESLCRDCSIFDTTITLSNLAKMYYNRCDYTMAAYLYEEALQLQTSIVTKDHQVVLDTLGNIALSKAMAGETTNSLQIFKTLQNLQSEKYGPESREAIETKALMSILLIQQSNYTVALRYLQELLKWQSEHLDDSNPSVLHTKHAIEQISLVINSTSS